MGVRFKGLLLGLSLCRCQPVSAPFAVLRRCLSVFQSVFLSVSFSVCLSPFPASPPMSLCLSVFLCFVSLGVSLSLSVSRTPLAALQDEPPVPRRSTWFSSLHTALPLSHAPGRMTPQPRFPPHSVQVPARRRPELPGPDSEPLHVGCLGRRLDRHPHPGPAHPGGRGTRHDSCISQRRGAGLDRPWDTSTARLARVWLGVGVSPHWKVSTVSTLTFGGSDPDI